MLIEIKRKHSNDLYSEGLLCINDMRTTFTVESTKGMLPVGVYDLKIIKRSARKQYIGVFKRQVSKGFSVSKGFNPGTSETSPSTDSGQAEATETLQPTGWSIGIGLSWKTSKQNHLIAIGERLIAGALYKATPIYERLIDRLMKCESRGEGIQLVISADNCVPSHIIDHWIEPNNHYCPPTTRRVERLDDCHYEIYDGEDLVRTIVLREHPLNP